VQEQKVEVEIAMPVERQRESLRGMESLRTESDKTEFLDVV
jgi:hypothetical protein